MLVGIANAISNIFFRFLPTFNSARRVPWQGSGANNRNVMQKIYSHIHMQILVADKDTIMFHKKGGFSRADETTPLWIDAWNDH